MTRVFTLFLAGIIGITLRWFIVGIFEVYQLMLLSLLLLACPVVLCISVRQKKKDAEYFPDSSAGHWSTSLSDQLLTGEKKLYIGENLIATYHRFYIKKYHKIIADLMNTPGLWYLRLAFRFEDGRSYTVICDDSLKGDNRYTIWEDDSQIAEIETIYNAKNVTRLIEQTKVTIGNHVYEFRARSIRSQIEVLKDGSLIGEVHREMKGIRSLQIDSEHVSPENESILLISWIVFSYRFNK